MTDWIKQIIEGNKRVAMPIMTHPGIAYIGKQVMDAVTDGETHFRAIEAVVERFNMAACTVIMDLTVEAEAFGSQIEFAAAELPHVVSRLVANEADVKQLRVPDLTAGRVPAYLEANRLAVARFTDRPVFAGCIGPFSLAGRLYGMSEIMVAIYIEPETITLLLEKCTQFLLQYCRELKQLGVTGVIMAEPAAGLLSNEDCQIFSTRYIQPIVAALQDEDFTIILHNCGNQGQCTQAMVDSGAAALHFGNAINMVEALRDCPADRMVMGNLDPVGILKQSTPDVVFQKTTELLTQTASARNYILSTGCDVPLVPTENIHAFYAALQAFNRNR